MIFKQQKHSFICPVCNVDLYEGQDVPWKKILGYKPLACGNCKNRFSINPVVEVIYTIFALGFVATGLSIDELRALQENSHPYLKVYAMAGVTASIFLIALAFKLFIPMLVRWENDRPDRYFVHYLTLTSFLLAILTFVFVVVTQHQHL